jgi:general secretion pathway protein J
MKKNSGFTLMEILIAVAILSIIAVLMVRGLQIVMKSKERIDDASERLEQLQLTTTLLQQDLQQILNRPIVTGDNQSGNAISFSALPPAEFSFTRGGYANPNGLEQRSSLQRVSYRFTQGNLTRVNWPVLDRTLATPSYSRIVLSGLKTLQWRFLANNLQFYTDWPADTGQTIPRAIELQLIFEDGRELKQLFVINAGDMPKSDSSSSEPQAEYAKR